MLYCWPCWSRFGAIVVSGHVRNSKRRSSCWGLGNTYNNVRQQITASTHHATCRTRLQKSELVFVALHAPRNGAIVQNPWFCLTAEQKCVCVSLCVYVSVSVSVSVCVCACVRACATWKRNKQWVCKCLQTADLMQVFVNIYKPIKQSVLLAFWSCLWPGKISPCLHHPNPDWIEVFCEHLQTNQPICSFVCGLAKSVLVFIIPILLRNGPVSIF